jgi:hypothetical protein
VSDTINVLINNSMPDIVKIAFTQGELQQRIKVFYNGLAGVSLPFYYYFILNV